MVAMLLCINQNKICMKKLIYTSLIAAVSLCSCSKDSSIGNHSESISILAILDEGVYTKTIVDQNPTHVYPKGRIGILWNSDDKIGVYSAKTKNASFSSDMLAGTTTEAALFSGKLDGPALYAYFPYSDENSNSDYTEVEGEIPEVQVFDTLSRRIPADYKIGIQRKDANGTLIAGSFQFTSILSLFRIDIDATGTALAEENLQSITFTFPEGAIARGQFTMDLSNQTTSIDSGDGANILTMSWGNSPVLKTGRLYTGFITCAPMKCKDQNVIITIETNGHTATITTKLSTDFTFNTMYTFPLMLSKWAALGEGVWALSAKN